jgi:oligogalacturonide lyase
MNQQAAFRLTTALTAMAAIVWIAMPPSATAQPAATHERLSTSTGSAIPLVWIDRQTGHRVMRLSRGRGEYHSFYFHNNPFIKDFDRPDGHPPDDLMVFRGVGEEDPGLFTVNLRTRVTRKVGEGGRAEIVARRAKEAYFEQDGAIWATHLLRAETRKVADLPEDFDGTFRTLNADETLLAGVQMLVETPPRPEGETKAAMMQRVFDAKYPRRLVVMDVATGAIRTVLEEPNWFNHLQFSPTDPSMLMYCHEGPWHLLDRIWTIPIDVAGARGRLMLKRTVDREIAGHEFWDPTGKRIWADHQIPRGDTFYLTSIDMETAETKKWALERDQWSVHFNISPDGTFFAGDGGSPGMVARAPDGQWIYLFRPGDGKLEAEKLCSMAKHDYALEPNVHITPDQKWVVFRSNMHGKAHVYAVEIARAEN